MRWLAGMADDPQLGPVSAATIGLYTRARICQTFPAYKLHELRDTPAAEILQAMELLSLADKVKSG